MTVESEPAGASEARPPSAPESDASGQAYGGGEAPSRTSQVVALARAEFARPHTVDGDADAQRRLCAGMQPPPDGWTRPDLIDRTRFFDEQVLAAIAAGVGQIVILGAGYDDRALRFRSQGVRYFELDHPTTQADKARRLLTLELDREQLVPGQPPHPQPTEPTLAPADFRHDDVGAVLAAVDHEANAPSLFICEGLLVYLDELTIARLLGALRVRAASGSALAVSLAVHPDGIDSEHVVNIANALRRTAAREPWRSILPMAAHTALFAAAGWQLAPGADAAPPHGDAAGRRSLFVVARPS
jgi:methyltransferase (TIGR00027 family)